MENAILNLAINARDAMEGTGKLTIEAGNAFLDDVYAAHNADVTAGQYVMLAVTDTGCGMTSDVIERVFEPFFTTRPESIGTGLGLSMVYGFVKQSGGHVKIYSEPGQGTTVRIYLPRAREEEDVEINVGTGPASGGNETVLVVEDDEDVRATVVDMLSELGYRVLRAKNAEGGLAIVHGGRLDDGVDLLSKPYSREALARKLRHVLQNQQQRNLRRSLPSRSAGKHWGAPPESRTLRVLVVEDDAMIRSLTVEMLAQPGRYVAEAAHANEAFELLDQREFDVLMADLVLPDIAGEELAGPSGSPTSRFARRVCLWLRGASANSPERGVAGALFCCGSRIM
ncbi:MAG: response regulator [Acetobacteraceae bacterium]|nr:response regulator [Acetobacteraceae bacterium]